MVQAPKLGKNFFAHFSLMLNAKPNIKLSIRSGTQSLKERVLNTKLYVASYKTDILLDSLVFFINRSI